MGAVFENTTCKHKSLLAFVDDHSTIVCVKKDVSEQLRHLRRTHRVNLAWCRVDCVVLPSVVAMPERIPTSVPNLSRLKVVPAPPPKAGGDPRP
jgi:hypothetical protein